MRLMKQLGYALAQWTMIMTGVALFTGATAGMAVAAVGHGTPEIDPGAIGSAITLFVGGAMYLTSRRRAQ